MKKAYLDFKKRLDSQEILQVALACFLFAWVAFIAAPFDMVAANLIEFLAVPGKLLLWDGVLYAVPTFLGLMLSYAALALVLKSSVRKLLLLVVVVLSISAWLNSTFFVGPLGKFDWRGVIEINSFSLLGLIQILAFIGILALAFFFRHKPKIAIYALLFACLVSLVTGVINISSKFNAKLLPQDEDKNSLFTYSKSKPNLLFVILDEYQSDYFSNILSNQMRDDLKGFTWFKDMASNFAFTSPSLPAIFTGKIYPNTLDFSDFYREISKDSFANHLANQGFRVSYNTPVYLSQHFFPNKTLNTFRETDPDYLNAYWDIANFSLFRLSPNLLKHYVYPRKPGFKTFALKSLEYFASKKLIAIDGPPTFKFYHSLITHAPVTADASCKLFKDSIATTLHNKVEEGRCAMTKVLQIIDHLKEAGVFDNTMIIIAADHGSEYGSWPYKRAAPIFLIKPLGSHHRFQISSAEVQLSDLPKTIARVFHLPNTSYPGVDILGDSIPKHRVRLYNHVEEVGNPPKNRLGPITQYEITGALNNPDSWKSLKKTLPLDCQAAFKFSDPKVNQYYDSNLHYQEHWGRWSEGKKAKIKYHTKPGCQARSVTFNLLAFNPPQHPKQTASVFINDQKIGDIQLALKKAEIKAFTFPLPKALDHHYTVDFYIDHAVSPNSLGLNQDTRELGLGFISMKLSSDEATAP